ncbi:hypothetical protein AK830_g4259 [Neonectria ditissima]|uniref:PD-(D/E)XK nuclease-like domain-containing protein n=1 Tax=Neonectria ditissima TaxID=78410 RepID=A0A0P7BNT9_9HYPO|nr:hypothetical protein AK830_g4259 [Neonectria ditissima]
MYTTQLRSLAALKMLADTLGKPGSRQHAKAHDLGKDRHEDETATQNLGEGITFLPGILIDGHVWSFVASTPAIATRPDNKGQGGGDGHGTEAQKAALYAKIPLGTTETPLGIYSIAVSEHLGGGLVLAGFQEEFLGCGSPRLRRRSRKGQGDPTASRKHECNWAPVGSFWNDKKDPMCGSDFS